MMNGHNTDSNRTSWNVSSTKQAQNTINPIRHIVEGMKIDPNPEKEMILLSIGDPTKFGNMMPSEILENAVITSIKSRKYNGYAPSVGFMDAREAVAKYSSTPEAPVTATEVILTSGCSDAIDMVISGLVNPGEAILIPRPGFSLYRTLAHPLGIITNYYDLLNCRTFYKQPDREWQVDIDHMESLIDGDTRLIVINNPSNPCGSVYTKEHLLDIIAVARRHKIPILADEIYAHFVFPGYTYHPMASLSHDVPIFSCAGLAKRFIVPGWRMGWIIIHDPCNNLLPEVKKGLQNLSQRIVGPNTLVQGAMTQIFDKIPDSYFDDIIDIVSSNALTTYKKLSMIPGLTPVMPRGAMYIMVQIDLDGFDDEINTDMEFVQRLVNEQSVFCLPGSCFQFPGFFRSVLTLPREKVDESCERILQFCHQHYR